MLSDAIKKNRKKRKLSQTEVAYLIRQRYGIPATSGMLSRYENTGNPVFSGQMSIPFLFALSQVLELDLTAIADEEMLYLKQHPDSIPFQSNRENK